MDLIERQDAIEVVKGIDSYFVKYIEALQSAQPEPQWISCSERLPEEEDYRPCYGYEDGVVWWMDDSGLMGLGWYCKCTRTWEYYDEISYSTGYVGNVIAWMPIPEAWRGDAKCTNAR